MSQPISPKVMLVEDDPSFVYLLQRYARASGCQLVHTGLAGEVLPLARQENPDLILIDIALGLDDSDGWHLLEALRTDSVTRKMAVYVCSASEAVIQACEELADGCLLQPVMYEDFLAVLERVPGRTAH